MGSVHAHDEDSILQAITVLPVRDILESTNWYARALGLNTRYLHEGDDADEAVNYAILGRGGFRVHLILDEPGIEQSAWMRAGCGYLYLLVRDLDALFSEVRGSGVTIARSIETELWGARTFNLVDPSGNSIHIEELA